MQAQPPPLPPANPYAAPAARVGDIVEEGDQVLAERGTRLAAAFVDGLIFGAAAIVMAILGPIMVPKGGGQANVAALTAIFFLIFFVGMLAIAIVNMVLLHRYGQTIAKRLFKIKITRSDGSRCSLLRVIFMRALPVGVLGAIPFVGMLVSLLDPLLIFRDDYRCLHDHIADTIVVKT